MRARRLVRRTSAPDHRDRGSVIALDLLITGLVAGALLLGLAGVLASTYSARGTLDRAADLSDRRSAMERSLADVLAGAVVPDVCTERIDPAAATSWANCRRRVAQGAAVLSASATSICTTARPNDGNALTAGQSGLSPAERACIRVDPVVGLTVEWFAVIAGDRLTPIWSEDASTREVLLPETAVATGVGGAAVAPLRYFAADGTELSPSGDPAVLDTTQRADVARVRLTIDTAAFGSSVTTLEMEWRLGVAASDDDTGWLGR